KGWNSYDVSRWTDETAGRDILEEELQHAWEQIRGKDNPHFKASPFDPHQLKVGDWFRKGRFQYEVEKIDDGKVYGKRNDYEKANQNEVWTFDELADEYNPRGGGRIFDYDYQF